MNEAPDGVTLSVLIVTWNVRDLVLRCVDSLYRNAGDMELDVIIVDNASGDDTVAAVRRAFPQVDIVANPANVGFPLANNQALERARGEYVLFLNPDTEVGEGAVQACLAELRQDASIGLAGCRLVLESGRTQLECARRDYLLRHMLIETLYLHMLLPRSRVFGDHLMSYWDHRGIRDVEAICGAFMMARTRAARAVGGLPADVFMYHEDLAFCLRLRRAGWRIRYHGDVETLHRWRGSSSKSAAKLALLEGVYKVQLIRDAQGPLFAAVARAVFTVRCATRFLGGGLGSLLLGSTRIAKRYPRVLDWRTHGLQLVWCVAPFLVDHLVPRAPTAPPGAPESMHAAAAEG